MLKRLFSLNSFKVGLIATLVILVAFFYSSFTLEGSFLKLLDKQWVDFTLKRREVRSVDPAVVIAVVDTKSVDAYGRWPWPRKVIAQMISALNAYQVRTIGLDVVFSEPENLIRDQEIAANITQLANENLTSSAAGRRVVQLLNDADGNGDRLLARALAARDSVVLGYFFFGQKSEVAHLDQKEIQVSASYIAASNVKLRVGKFERGTIPTGAAVEPNIKALHDVVNLAGYFNIQPDIEDGIVRRVHLFTEYENEIYPALSLQSLRHYYGASNIRLQAAPEGGLLGVYLDDKFIRTNFDGSIQVNYKGPSQTIPHISVKDIIEGTVPPANLKDKLVLVGATEVGIFDLRATPVQANYPGVEIHATLIENLLTNSYFHLDILNDFISGVLILALGLLLSLLLPRMKNLYANLMVLSLLLGYSLLHRLMVNQLLSWTSYIFVLLVIFSVWISITLYRFFVTDKDRRFIRSAFQQYLSPEVIDQLSSNPDLLKLGGEERVMTAFFADVAGFSTISENMSPEELVGLLNEYLTKMTDTITENGGTVDKYEGDAIIAFFGAPIPYTDHAIRGCSVALKMQAQLAELRQKWKSEDRPELYVRIGLNSGPMVVGNMGSEKRFDYTMIGNAVNLASRLEGANKNYGSPICVSEFTYEAAKDHFEFRELDLIRVVGIQQPVHIYQVVAKTGDATPAQKEGIQSFAQGLSAYRQQKWDEAALYFNACKQQLVDDSPSDVYLQRCQEYKASPPALSGESWDGVFVATSK